MFNDVAKCLSFFEQMKKVEQGEFWQSLEVLILGAAT